MSSLRWPAAAVLAVATLTAAPGLPAAACACGGVISPDLDARVTDEQALISLNDGTETIVMRLNLQSGADNAALIVPTPAPATAGLTGPALFDELFRLTAPRVEKRASWTFGADRGTDEAAATAPVVVRQVQLGPVEATTLTGGDLDGVRRWLASHGYRTREEVLELLAPYLQQGWSFVAMRLTGEQPLSGELAPVKLAFASDRLVYPMRMSAAADASQRVVVFALGTHRLQRIDPDTGGQIVSVDYAGPVSGRVTDDTLAALSRDNGYLTRITTEIVDPESITADFEFAPARTDEPYQRVLRRRVERDATPVALAGMAVGGLALMSAAALRWRRTRR